jgi:hypothetical protein
MMAGAVPSGKFSFFYPWPVENFELRDAKRNTVTKSLSPRSVPSKLLISHRG